jgi:hypothetical protein
VEGAVSDAALVARLDRLEAVARRDRTVLLGLIAILIGTAQAPATLGSSTPVSVAAAGGGSATITGKGLVIRDAARTLREDVGLDASGYPSVDLFRTSGAIAQSLYLLKDTPVLRQFDPGGKPRADLYLTGLGNPEFAIHDAKATPRLKFFYGSAGQPTFALFASNATARASLAPTDDTSALTMLDAAATTRIVLGAYTTLGKAGLDVREKSGTAVFSKP